MSDKSLIEEPFFEEKMSGSRENAVDTGSDAVSAESLFPDDEPIADHEAFSDNRPSSDNDPSADYKRFSEMGSVSDHVPDMQEDEAGQPEEQPNAFSFMDDVTASKPEENPIYATPHWYCAHTYSGYENKVKTNIEKTIANRHLEDQILEVRVPLQEVRELKNGVFRHVQKKIFPGYVLVNMIMNEDNWRVVRYTRGVTGFVGPESKAVPLSEEELLPMIGMPEELELDISVGDLVTVTCDPWKNEKGVVARIDLEKETVVLTMDMFTSGPSEVEVGLTNVRRKL